MRSGVSSADVCRYRLEAPEGFLGFPVVSGRDQLMAGYLTAAGRIVEIGAVDCHLGMYCSSSTASIKLWMLLQISSRGIIRLMKLRRYSMPSSCETWWNICRGICG